MHLPGQIHPGCPSTVSIPGPTPFPACPCFQACIMAVGASRTVTVIGADGALATKSVMRVTLSADHRVYDGEIASDLLAAFKANLEAPFKLLL